MWTKPAFTDLRIGFEVTMYFASRCSRELLEGCLFGLIAFAAGSVSVERILPK